MAKDIQDRVGQFLGSDSGKQLVGVAVNELLNGFGNDKPKKAANKSKSIARKAVSRAGSGSSDGPLSGARGIAAGAGAAALAPVVVKGVGKLIKGGAAGSLAAGPKKLVEGAGSKLGDTVGDKVTGKIDEAGGPSGIVKDAVKSALPFGGDSGPKGGVDGVGKGRRMPIQQSVDIALPIETVYNQWTRFEEWPLFMHRVTRVTQKDPCTISFATKIWGKTKEFTAKIDTQRPDDRVKWRVSQGMTHTGHVSFRELTPALTRVELGLDVQPGGPLEKLARGGRHIKRAVRGDLHRFKAFIEMLEHETGAWRGVIEDGKVVKDHDSSYDRKREYASADELLQDSDEEKKSGDRGSKKRGQSRNGGDPSPRKSRSASRSQSSRSGSKSRSSGQRSSGGSTRTRAQSSRSSSSKSSGGSSSRSRSSGNGSRSRSSNSSGSRSSGSSSRSRSSGKSSQRQRARS